MPNESNIRIETKFGKFEATYFNNIVKPNTKVIVKAPNGRVVTEKVMEVGNIEKVKYQLEPKEVVTTELTKQWADTDGNIYEKKDLKYYDWEGNQITENIKTAVFVGEKFMPLTQALNTCSFEAYYTVTPDNLESMDVFKVQEALSGNHVLIGEFNLTSRGFTKSFAALRSVSPGKFEFMVFKAMKVV